MLLSCNGIKKSFGEYNILSDCSFFLEEREKAAVVGINGAGKSTLLKIIAGEIKQDSGDVVVSVGKNLGYLSQHQEISENITIYEEVLKAKQFIIDLEEKIRSLEHDMNQDNMETYNRLTHEFEINNGFAYQSEITGVLKGLGFKESEFSKNLLTLSGGEKTRVALAKLLLLNPDILLLDEPTNHLDIDAIRWLENYLLNYKGSVLIVTHDRYFLDKVVSKVVELDRGNSSVFSGNYSEYVQKKERLIQDQLKAYQNRQREIKHQEDVIEKLRSFNREKSIKRAESREKLLDKIEVLEKPTVENKKMKISIEPRNLSGNDVLVIKDLKKEFDGNVLFEDFNTTIFREEKVAVIGNNGTGKTTLLKILNEFIADYQGEIKIGSKVKIGYYDQEHNILDMNKNIFEEVRDAFPNLNNTRIRNVLAAFLFTGDEVYKRIMDISGGERGRVSLAKLMLSEANFLVMDEPTNHLDIVSKEILENALNSYAGTVLYVSHDRYFINKTATRILELENKKFNNYSGNYDYYIEQKERSVLQDFSLNSETEKTESKAEWEQKKEEQARERKRENDLKKTEEDIFKLEQKLKELDFQLENPEICSDVAKLVQISNEKDKINSKLESFYEIWETLAN